MAGYPTFVGSDRAKAFVEGAVNHLIDYFGIQHVIGSACHPQSQAPFERPHREYNAMCWTFCDDNKEWDLVAPLLQRAIRTTAKVFNNTPYELVTGLAPRSPVDALLSQPSTLVKLPQTEYVKDLCSHFRDIHQFVDADDTRVREN